MYGVAAISTAMNLVELNYLLSHWVSERLQTLRERRIQMQAKSNQIKNDGMYQHVHGAANSPHNNLNPRGASGLGWRSIQAKGPSY